MIYTDRKNSDLTTTLKPWFPNATWIEYTPIYNIETKREASLIDQWVPRCVDHLETLTIDRIASRTLRQSVGAQKPVVSDTMWRRILQTLHDRGDIPWMKDDSSLIRMTARALGFEVHAA